MRDLHPGMAVAARIRSLAVDGLRRMYRPDQKLFAFRLRRTRSGTIVEGVSRRYTAIALIGLASETDERCASILAGARRSDLCKELISYAAVSDNLGDVALILWAACAIGYADRRPAWERLITLRPADQAWPVVDVAWALAALCADSETPRSAFRDEVARRLISSCQRAAEVFPHFLGHGRSSRSHVSCFADLVYPVHALARYVKLSGDDSARDLALRCARVFCRHQGPHGQWWWHYDRRTGEVIERYPVYAVHQDAMAPMALFAIGAVAGLDFSQEILKGLAWLTYAPELGGASLIDDETHLIWRKVARREPRKLSRFLQGAASRLHPSLRVPGLDFVFPIGTVDYEDRPYHLGWLLYAWPHDPIINGAAKGVCG